MTHNSRKNRGSTLILTNVVGVHPWNIHTKFEANPCIGLKEEVKNVILHNDIRVYSNTLGTYMLHIKLPRNSLALFDGNRSYNLDLNKLE